MRSVLLIVAAVLLLATPSPPPCKTNPPQPDRRHPSGLLLVAPLDFCALRNEPSIYEPLAKAWSDARDLAEAHPTVLGHPWADRATGQLVISTVNPDGEAVARAWIASGATITNGVKTEELSRPQVPVRFRKVIRSWADFSRLEDDLIAFFRTHAQGTDAVRSFGVDEERNVILIEVQTLSDELASALATRFGTEAIALRVDPNSSPFVSIAASLQALPAISLDAAIVIAGCVLLVGAAIWLALRRRPATG